MRTKDGRTATEVAQALSERTGEPWPTSKLTRMERNEWARPSVRDIRDLLDEYGVTDERKREGMLTLAREGRQRGWWDTMGLPGTTTTFIGLEAEAETELSWRTGILPGLVQTADYARAVMRNGPAELPDEEIERRVEARLKRQTLLTEGGLRLWVVMDEAVLRRTVGGPEVMRAQMKHLLEVAKLPRVTFQTVPFDVGAHPGTNGSFAIVQFPDPDLPAVYVEAIAGELFIEEPPEVRQYEVAFQRLTAMAMPPDATLKLIAASAA